MRKNIRVDVRTLVAKDGVGRLLEVGAESYLVRHSTGRQEECCLFAGELGHVCLKSNSRGLMVNIVAERGERCINKHFLGWNCTSFEFK